MMRRQEASREKQYVRSPSIVTGQPLSFRPSRPSNVSVCSSGDVLLVIGECQPRSSSSGTSSVFISASAPSARGCHVRDPGLCLRDATSSSTIVRGDAAKQQQRSRLSHLVLNHHNLEDISAMTGITDLPIEIFTDYILSFLPVSDILHLAQTCRVSTRSTTKVSRFDAELYSSSRLYAQMTRSGRSA